MKTAMQELITHLEMLKSRVDVADIDSIIEYATNALEKEKKQITDACWYGHDIKHEYFNPIHYFDQTYNQNK